MTTCNLENGDNTVLSCSGNQARILSAFQLRLGCLACMVIIEVTVEIAKASSGHRRNQTVEPPGHSACALAGSSRGLDRGAEGPGFTLVELVVVMVIIGIIVAIAAPSFVGYIRKAQVNGLIHRAELNEKSCMELTGMQYAEEGNPYIGIPASGTSGNYYSVNNSNWNATLNEASPANFVIAETQYGSQYFYLDSLTFTIDGQDLLRGSVANSYADPKADSSGQIKRQSAGITAYKQRTLSDFAPASFLTSYGVYGNCATWLWFVKPDDSDLQQMNKDAVNPYFFQYDLVFSECWFSQDGKDFGVFHNFRFNNATATLGQADDRTSDTSVTPGWFVYEYRDDGKWYLYN